MGHLDHHGWRDRRTGATAAAKRTGRCMTRVRTRRHYDARKCVRCRGRFVGRTSPRGAATSIRDRASEQAHQGVASVNVETDPEPGRMTGELEVAGEVGQLLYLRRKHGRFGDVLFATTDAVAGFGEEATLPGT